MSKERGQSAAGVGAHRCAPNEPSPQQSLRAVIVTGGATSNCIRATVFDAASYNFRAIVPEEAVFDRIPISHAISLFDMDRQFADVVPLAQVLEYLKNCGAARLAASVSEQPDAQ